MKKTAANYDEQSGKLFEVQKKAPAQPYYQKMAMYEFIKIELFTLLSKERCDKIKSIDYKKRRSTSNVCAIYNSRRSDWCWEDLII